MLRQHAPYAHIRISHRYLHTAGPSEAAHGCCIARTDERFTSRSAPHKSRSIRMSLTHPSPLNPQPLHSMTTGAAGAASSTHARHAHPPPPSHTSRGVTFMHDHTRLSRETQHKATVRARHAPQQPSSATILLVTVRAYPRPLPSTARFR